MWTEDNTEGFTASECAAANAITSHVMAFREDIDTSSVNDALNNTYTAGIDPNAWERKVFRYFGITEMDKQQ